MINLQLFIDLLKAVLVSLIIVALVREIVRLIIFTIDVIINKKKFGEEFKKYRFFKLEGTILGQILGLNKAKVE